MRAGWSARPAHPLSKMLPQTRLWQADSCLSKWKKRWNFRLPWKQLRVQILVNPHILRICLTRVFFFSFFFPPHLICSIKFRKKEKMEGKNGGKERETLITCLLTPLDWGSKPQPRYVPWPESNPPPFGVGRRLQPTAPPSQGNFTRFLRPWTRTVVSDKDGNSHFPIWLHNYHLRN